MPLGVGNNPIVGGGDVLTGDMVAGDLLDGKTGYSTDSAVKITGNMPNNGSDDVEVTDLAGTLIPEGYYDGSGRAELSAAEKAKVIAGNIKDGVTILGVAGDYDPQYLCREFYEDDTFVVPAGVTSIDAFLVGGGGASHGDSSAGGGGYTATFLGISVSPAENVTVVVGAGGAAGYPGDDGGKSWIKTEGSYYANGGKAPTGSYPNIVAGDGGSGGGSAAGDDGSGGTSGDGGSNGGNGEGTRPGTGQGTTTREFGVSVGRQFGGGGAGAVGFDGGDGGGGYYDAGDADAIHGVDGLGGGGCGTQMANGGSGIVIVRYKIP